MSSSLENTDAINKPRLSAVCMHVESRAMKRLPMHRRALMETPWVGVGAQGCVTGPQRERTAYPDGSSLSRDRV